MRRGGFAFEGGRGEGASGVRPVAHRSGGGSSPNAMFLVMQSFENAFRLVKVSSCVRIVAEAIPHCPMTPQSLLKSGENRGRTLTREGPSGSAGD